MRGKHLLVFDTIENANAARRQLVEELNFPPVLAFSHEDTKGAAPSASHLAQALPPNIKLLTLTNNYAAHNNGTILLRLAHLYAHGEHPTLSAAVTLSLRAVFAKSGLTVASAEETSLTANQLAATMDASRSSDPWNTGTAGGARLRLNAADPHLMVTIQPMEVRTYLVALA